MLDLIVACAFNQFSLMPSIARAQREGGRRRVSSRSLYVALPKVVWTEMALGLGGLFVVPFLINSARSQAAGKDVDGPTFDTGLFTLGLLLVVTLALCFYTIAKASEILGCRSTTA